MPNEADKELDWILLLNQEYDGDWPDYQIVGPHPEKLKAQLLAWRDRAVRAGRIEELMKLIGTGGLTPDLQVEYWNARLAILTAEPKEEQ